LEQCTRDCVTQLCPANARGAVVSITERLDDLQRRHPAAGFPLAVLYKYFDDQGGSLAALIAYYAFLSLFPLLLLLSTILGIVLVGHPGLQDQVLHSALSQFPVIGDQLGQPKRVGGGSSGWSSGSWVRSTAASGWRRRCRTQ